MRTEYPYVHLQWRRMSMADGLESTERYMIVPDEFIPYEVDCITTGNFDSIKKMGFCDLEQRNRKNKWLRRIRKITGVFGR